MKKSASTVLAAVILASCAPATPQARIQKSPEKFAALSRQNQDLVKQGQIARGMPPEAVELAWGPPDRRLEGSRNSKPMERWEYAGTRPVYFTNFFGGYGYGYGGYGPYGDYGYSGIALGLGPEVAYVPYQAASVSFIDRRVDSWEKEL